MSGGGVFADESVELQPRVDNGRYVAELIAVEPGNFFGSPKLRLDFKLTVKHPSGETVDSVSGEPVVIPRHLNFPKPGTKLTQRHDLFVEFVAMTGGLPSGDVIEAFKALEGGEYVVQVGLVIRRWNRAPLPPLLHYSKVEAIISPVDHADVA